MAKIRLSDPDRERLGCEEWLDYDQEHLPVEYAEALEAAGGSWLDYGKAGPLGAKARVWVALYRSGVTVSPYGALTFDMLGIQADGLAPGKAPSASGDSRTPSTSRGSARRTRSKT